MKKLYLFLNKNMHTLAVIWAACLLLWHLRLAGWWLDVSLPSVS